MFSLSVDPGTTHVRMAALCTSNLGSRCHPLDTVMKRQRFTADRLYEHTGKEQARAMEAYEQYKDKTGIEKECRYHNLCMCNPAAFCVARLFSFSLPRYRYYRFAFVLLHTKSQQYMCRYAPEESSAKLKAESEVGFEWSTESQVASTAKLCREFEKRSDDNSEVCDVLYNHQHLWASVGGPPVESLFRPSVGDIEQVRKCCDTLQKMAEGDDPDTITDS